MGLLSRSPEPPLFQVIFQEGERVIKKPPHPSIVFSRTLSWKIVWEPYRKKIKKRRKIYTFLPLFSLIKGEQKKSRHFAIERDPLKWQHHRLISPRGWGESLEANMSGNVFICDHVSRSDEFGYDENHSLSRASWIDRRPQINTQIFGLCSLCAG